MSKNHFRPINKFSDYLGPTYPQYFFCLIRTPISDMVKEYCWTESAGTSGHLPLDFLNPMTSNENFSFPANQTRIYPKKDLLVFTITMFYYPAM